MPYFLDIWRAAKVQSDRIKKEIEDKARMTIFPPFIPKSFKPNFFQESREKLEPLKNEDKKVEVEECFWCGCKMKANGVTLREDCLCSLTEYANLLEEVSNQRIDDVVRDAEAEGGTIYVMLERDGKPCWFKISVERGLPLAKATQTANMEGEAKKSKRISFYEHKP